MRLLGDRLTVGQKPLKLLIGVRFPVPQLRTFPHSLGRRTVAFEAINFGSTPSPPAKKVRSSFCWREADLGGLRQGIEDLASIICEYLEQIIRKVY